MKIEYVHGDLMLAPEKYIMHGCNACGVMGSGVANLIRLNYPKAYLHYVKTFNHGGLKLGSVFFVETEGKMIINAITQEDFGRDGQKYVCYDAIKTVIRKISQILYPPIQRVAMPKIGAGLGGGDWEIISKIIEDGSEHFQPVVYEL